jgi:hypothetical protein
MDTDQAVRRVCLWLPSAEEFPSHGSPNFRVCGKTFASFTVNHHGDGRVALWLKLPAGAQDALVSAQPRHFFVPPYVGVRGWVGLRLDRGIAWQRVVILVREAYESVAPPTLRAAIGTAPVFRTPPTPLKAAAIDPFQAPRAAARLKRLRQLLAGYPQVSEAAQFGQPVWRVGKKTFVIARFHEAQLTFCFWVGVAQQGLYTADPRFQIPAYMGHNGWIALDVQQRCDWREVESMALGSYRHFATRTLLRSLPPLD